MFSKNLSLTGVAVVFDLFLLKGVVEEELVACPLVKGQEIISSLGGRTTAEGEL